MTQETACITVDRIQFCENLNHNSIITNLNKIETKNLFYETNM